MSKMLSRIGLVSSFTMLSRVLGLARDMLTSAVFGATVWNSAFITAFTLPNLFRRLLGEGALTAALMPNLSDELVKNGRFAVHTLVNKTLTWLLVVCVSITLVAVALFYTIEQLAVSHKWILVAELAKVLFPYVTLICLAAVVSAALNLFGKFGIPALTAVWLNSCIIVFLGASALFFADSMRDRMVALCFAVLVGGGLQLIIPSYALWKEGWRPRLDFEVSPRLKEVIYLTGPGILGAAVYQINVMVSRGLSYTVDNSGATLLYLSNRLVELPIGVFAIAVSTVIFPALSKAIASDDTNGFGKSYRDGVLLSLLMALPASGGLIVLGQDFVTALFQRGMFGEDDTLAMNPIVIIFALGMPFYAFVSIETRAFFSMKNTATPVRVAGLALVVNVVLSLALMPSLKLEGLAIASNLAVVVQAIVLHYLLRKKAPYTRLGQVTGELLKLVVAAIIMSFVVYGLWLLLERQFGATNYLPYLSIFGLIPAGVVVYFSSLKLMRCAVVGEVMKFIKRR